MGNVCRCYCHPHTQWGPDSQPGLQAFKHPPCGCTCCRLPIQETPVSVYPSQQLLRFFKSDHLPDPLKGTADACRQLAQHMEVMLPDGPEKTMGLRKLLEAKDCFIRSLLPTEGEAYIGTPGAAYKDVDIEVPDA